MKEVKRLARICAVAALEHLGPSPYDADGEPLCPAKPLEMDWVALEEKLGRQPTAEESTTFELCFLDWISKSGWRKGELL